MLVLLSSTVATLYYYGFTVKETVVKSIRQDLSNLPQIVSSNSQESSTDRDEGFMTAIRYSGQQGSGIKALKSLQCFAGTLGTPMNILEPTIIHGTLVADLTSVESNSSHIKISSLFDIGYINKLASENGLAHLTATEHFFSHAPKKIVLVIMKWVSRSIPESERNMEIIWPDMTNIQLNKCLDTRNSPNEVVHKHVARLSTDYCIIKVVQAPFSPARKRIFSQEEARNVIYGKLLLSEVITVFSLWREGWFCPPTNNNENILECPTLDLYKPSQAILGQAKWYENEYLGGEATVSIMFRLERMVEFLHDSPHMDSEKCLAQVVHITNEIRAGHSQFNKPFLTLDFGDSGSTSWANTVSHFALNITDLINKTKKTISKLFTEEWSLKTWESGFINAAEGNTNPGYIAALQRVIASRSKCLILVGGGHFQSIAVNDYLRYRPDSSQQCVHFVCAKEYLTH